MLGETFKLFQPLFCWLFRCSGSRKAQARLDSECAKEVQEKILEIASVLKQVRQKWEWQHEETNTLHEQ